MDGHLSLCNRAGVSEAASPGRLDRPVDDTDHVLGLASAPITLVEYGSYACPHCRAANDKIASLRDTFGERVRYVFRHRPLTGSHIARRAAALVEHARDPEQFWRAHMALMSRSPSLTEEDLAAVAAELGVDLAALDTKEDARHRVDVDEASARASGVRMTPTFFINGRRYDGPWDDQSLADAMLGTLGHRVRSAALDFAAWAPSAGLMLLVASVLAVIVTNTSTGAAFQALWHESLGFVMGESRFELSLGHWVNDGLLTVFFLVVGLEIKRELTVGHLASRRSAAFPIAAALGGMAVPAAIYTLLIPQGVWGTGWGVPIATDTAFAIALIAMLGSRVPVELRIFLTAAAIVDDIVAVLVVAVFYSGQIQLAYVGGAAAVVAALALLARAHVYRVAPYALLGLVLWGCVYASGLHATLAGVLLALFIPTRPPPDLNALMTQASSIIAAESEHGGEVLRHVPSLPALQALDSIHDRIESPADRTLRTIAPWSSYFVLPVFAFANAGVVLDLDMIAGRELLVLAIACGLAIGKPLGLVGVSALAVKLGVATKSPSYSWRQLAGAGALAGIGFTMSLFIAAQAFPDPADFAAAKVAVFGGSVVSALVGVAVLRRAPSPKE